MSDKTLKGLGIVALISAIIYGIYHFSKPALPQRKGNGNGDFPNKTCKKYVKDIVKGNIVYYYRGTYVGAQGSSSPPYYVSYAVEPRGIGDEKLRLPIIKPISLQEYNALSDCPPPERLARP